QRAMWRMCWKCRSQKSSFSGLVTDRSTFGCWYGPINPAGTLRFRAMLPIKFKAYFIRVGFERQHQNRNCLLEALNSNNWKETWCRKGPVVKDSSDVECEC